MSDTHDLPPSSRKKRRPGTRVFWVLVLLAAVGIAAVWMLMPTEFRATAYVQVGSPVPTPPLTLEPPAVPREVMDRHIANQIVRISSESVLQEALSNKPVMETRWYQEAHGNVGPLLDELKNILRARRTPDTDLIEVSVRARNNHDAAVLANTIIQKYVVGAEIWAKLENRREYDRYREQVNAKMNQLLSRRKEMADFVESFRTPGVTSGLIVAGDTFRLLNEEVTRLEMTKLAARARYEGLRGMTTRPAEPEIRTQIEQDPRIAWLRDRILAAQIDMECKAAQAGANDAQVVALRLELQVLEAKMAEARVSAEHDVMQGQLETAELAFMDAIQVELSVRERLVSAEAALQDVDRKMAEFNSIREDVATQEQEYRELNAFTNKLGLMVMGASSSNIVRTALAVPPRQPDYERKVVASAGLGGIPLLFGLAILLYRMVANLCRPRS